MANFNNINDQIMHTQAQAQAHGTGDGASKHGSIFNLPDDVVWFKEKAGKVCIDIIPFVVTANSHIDGLGRRDSKKITVPQGSAWYRRQILIHYNVGANGGECICPRTVNGKCPICDFAFERYREDGDKDALKRLMPSTRELYNVQDATAQEPITQPWLISYGNFGKLFDAMKYVDADNLRFANLENGKTIEIVFSTEELMHVKPPKTFLKAIQIGFKERSYDIDSSFAENAFDLNKILVIHDYKTISDMMWGESADAEVEDVKAHVQQKSTRTVRSVVDTEKALSDAGLGPCCPYGHDWAQADCYPECASCENWEPCKESANNASTFPPEEPAAQPPTTSQLRRPRTVRQ